MSNRESRYREALEKIRRGPDSAQDYVPDKYIAWVENVVEKALSEAPGEPSEKYCPKCGYPVIHYVDKSMCTNVPCDWIKISADKLQMVRPAGEGRELRMKKPKFWIQENMVLPGYRLIMTGPKSRPEEVANVNLYWLDTVCNALNATYKPAKKRKR